MANQRAEIDVVVNGGQAKSTLNEIAKAVDGVATSAGKSGAAMSKIGEGADAGVDKAINATKRFEQQLKRLNLELESGGKNTAAYIEGRAKLAGADTAALAPLIAQYDQLRSKQSIANAEFTKAGKVMTDYGMGVKATSAALRQVPAQFTDIIVSLQGGQAPLTVLLQQGGQLKDVFGGVGNAFKALSGYVLGLINPFSLLAGAAGLVGVAYYQGSKELDAYNKALVLSGNYAGTTTGQLQNMAQAVSATTGKTVGAAAEALAQLAGTGDIAAANLTKFTSVAVQLEREAGIAVKDTVKAFSDLGKDPVSASEKLNAATHYLTAAVYEQIKALEDQGDKAGAASAAQEAYADAMNKRIPDLTQNLGLLERSWRSVAGAAKGAWDAMLNLGRSESIAEKIRSLQMQRNYIDSGVYGGFGDSAKKKAALDAELEYYKHILVSEQELAKYQGDSIKREEASIALSKKKEEFSTKLEKMQREMAVAQGLFDGSNKTAADIENYTKAVAGIQERYKATKQAKEALTEAAKGLALYNDLMATSVKVSASFTEDQTKLTAAYSTGAISLDQYQGAMTALVAKQPYMVASTKDQAEAIKEAGKAYEDSAKSAIKYYEGMAKDNATLDKSNEKLREELAGIGLLKSGKDAIIAARAEEVLLIEQQTLALMNMQNSSEMEIQQQQRKVDLLREQRDLRKNIAGAEGANELAKANLKAAKESEKYWEDALMRAFESGKGFFQSLWDTIKNTLKTQVLKVLIQGVGLGGSGAALAGESGTGILGLAGSIGSIASGAGMLGAAGNIIGGAIGAGTVGTGISASIGTALAAIGPVGWAAIGAAAIIGLRPSFTSAYGTGNATRAYDASGNATTTPWASEGGLTPTVDTALTAMYTGYAQAAKALGAEVAATSWYYGSNSGREAQNPNFRVKASVGGKSVYDSGGEVAMTEVALKLEASRAVLAALQASTLPGYIARAFDGIKSSVMTQEQIDATLSRAVALKANLSTTNAWLGVLKLRLLDVSISGSDAANSLVAAFGSLDNLAASSKAYYEAFYTESERTATSAKNLADAMALIGLAMPDTKAAFRDVVSGLDLSTEAGRNAYAVLLALAPEFSAIAAAIDKMATDTAASLIKAFTGDDKLIPALDAAALSIGDVASGATTFSKELTYINTVMGDSSSGVITLGGDIEALGVGMTASQASAGLLTEQIAALGLAADGSVIDFDALSTALLGVDPALVGTSIAQANKYLAGVDPLPLGVSMADVNGYLAAIDTSPFGLSMADISTALSGIDPALIGTSVDQANRYLSGLDALPVNVSMTDVNDYLAMINTTPLGSSIDDINTALQSVNPAMIGTSIADANRYLQGLDAMPVGITIEDVNRYLEAINGNPVLTSIEQINGALKGVNTETFVATVTMVFDNLATRIGSVIDSITAERVAVREAALQIINPTVMSKAQIQRGIDGIGTALPSNSGVVTANSTLAAADAALQSAQTQSINSANLVSGATTKMATDLSYYQGKVSDLYALANSGGYAVNSYAISGGATDMNNTAYRYDANTNRFADYGYNSYNTLAGAAAIDSQRPQRLALASILDQANPMLQADEAAIAAAAKALSDANLALAGAVTNQTTAAAAAKKAALDYAAALQTFAIDAGKSVTKLTHLREETVKYYEAQKALAELMGTSAAGLRKTVGDYRYGNLSDADQLKQLQGQFSSAYSMALASQGDGATLAGYGDKLNNLLNPLIDKLNDNGQGGLIGNYLAQAESVAALIEQGVPVNYQQDSLDLLGSIDATLAALDASSQSAETIIAGAVKAGSDRTADGLRAVIAALTGNAIPAFASGGSYSGGVALVGEDGPELINFNKPGQVFNASQTQGMFSGQGNAELIMEVRALRLEVSNLRSEARSTAISTAKIAKQGDRVEVEGLLTRTE